MKEILEMHISTRLQKEYSRNKVNEDRKLHDLDHTSLDCISWYRTFLSQPSTTLIPCTLWTPPQPHPKATEPAINSISPDNSVAFVVRNKNTTTMRCCSGWVVKERRGRQKIGQEYQWEQGRSYRYYDKWDQWPSLGHLQVFLIFLLLVTGGASFTSETSFVWKALLYYRGSRGLPVGVLPFMWLSHMARSKVASSPR